RPGPRRDRPGLRLSRRAHADPQLPPPHGHLACPLAGRAGRLTAEFLPPPRRNRSLPGLGPVRYADGGVSVMYAMGEEEITAVTTVLRSGQLFRYRGGEGGESDRFEAR